MENARSGLQIAGRFFLFRHPFALKLFNSPSPSTGPIASTGHKSAQPPQPTHPFSSIHAPFSVICTHSIGQISIHVPQHWQPSPTRYFIPGPPIRLIELSTALSNQSLKIQIVRLRKFFYERSFPDLHVSILRFCNQCYVYGIIIDIYNFCFLPQLIRKTFALKEMLFNF